MLDFKEFVERVYMWGAYGCLAGTIAAGIYSTFKRGNK